MKYFLVLNILLGINCALSGNIANYFFYNGIVPDVIPRAPDNLAMVRYSSGAQAILGNELTPTQVKNTPSVFWNADPHSYYTLALVDPDAPSRADPQSRSFRHWLVVNIPGMNVACGEALSFYIGSGPPKGSGLHRYVFLVYKQPGRIDFNAFKPSFQTPSKRGSFSIASFAAEHNFGDPIAGNFYKAQYDEYVPMLYEMLGL